MALRQHEVPIDEGVVEPMLKQPRLRWADLPLHADPVQLWLPGPWSSHAGTTAGDGGLGRRRAALAPYRVSACQPYWQPDVVPRRKSACLRRVDHQCSRRLPGRRRRGS